MPGLSRDEERQLDEMRLRTTKQLELLRIRQNDYHKTRTGAKKNDGRRTELQSNDVHVSVEASLPNVTSYNSRKADALVEPVSSTVESHSANSSLKFESYVPVSSKYPENRAASNGFSLPLSHNGGLPSARNTDILATQYSGDSSAIFNRSYVTNLLTDEASFYDSYRKKLSDWRTHTGQGDSYNDFRTDHVLFGTKNNSEPWADDHLVIDDGKVGRKLHNGMIPASELNDSSHSDVLTISDSQLDKSTMARNKLAEASRISSKVGDLQKDSAKVLEESRSYRYFADNKSKIGERTKDDGEKYPIVASPHQPSSADGTPKSILRHRKIIDDNIQVESKYEHTPTTSRTRSRRNLNFSYSDVDGFDITVPKSKSVNFSDSNGKIESNSSYDRETFASAKDSKLAGVKKSSRIMFQSTEGNQPHYAKPTNGLYPEERGREGHVGSELADTSGGRQISDKETKDFVPQDGHKSKVRDLVQRNLLLNSGNDRKNASIIRELESRPKSVFDLTGRMKTRSGRKSELGNGTDLESSVSRAYLDHPSTKEFSQMMSDRQGKPLLGYDWIAGLLDNETGSVATEPDDLFEAVKEFRRQNKDECSGAASRLLNSVDLSRPISPEVPNPSHTCIHGYNVNERLFTEPVNADAKGTSFCPVCLSSRQDPSQNSPGFVRVSIPRSTLESPHKFKPHRRRSFDPIDSCALSQHCLAGYECSRPSSIAAASNLDLKHAAHGIKSQLITTEDEARKIAESVSKTSQLIAPRPLMLPNVSLPRFDAAANGSSTLSSSQPDLSLSRSTRDSRSVTDELLNTSHSLRYQLQSLEKERGIAIRDEPNSTNFPLY